MAFATFLVDKPRKYKYNARPIYDEGILFLLPNLSEMETIYSKYGFFVKLTEPKKEFTWFLSKDFQELRQGFIPEEFECKEKVTMSEAEIFDSKRSFYELHECKEKNPHLH